MMRKNFDSAIVVGNSVRAELVEKGPYEAAGVARLRHHLQACPVKLERVSELLSTFGVQCHPGEFGCGTRDCRRSHK